MIGPMERDAPPHPANNVTPRWWGIGLDSCPYLVLVLNAPKMSMSMSMLVYRIDRCCGDVEENESEEDEPPSGMFS